VTGDFKDGDLPNTLSGHVTVTRT